MIKYIKSLIRFLAILVSINNFEKNSSLSIEINGSVLVEQINNNENGNTQSNINPDVRTLTVLTTTTPTATITTTTKTTTTKTTTTKSTTTGSCATRETFYNRNCYLLSQIKMSNAQGQAYCASLNQGSIIY
jgi:hypothetical protein